MHVIDITSDDEEAVTPTKKRKGMNGMSSKPGHVKREG
jgi:hypothetical protein